MTSKQALVLVAVFVFGAALGALFYPSKRVKEQERIISQLQAEKAQFEVRVAELQARSKETILVIEKPDGSKRTKITRKKDESRRQETVRTATVTEKQITQSQRSELTEINVRRFSVEIGMRTDKSYYLRGDADVVGPLFVGVIADSHGVMGVGLGLRF